MNAVMLWWYLWRITSKNGTTRSHASSMLAKMKDPRSIETLIAYLGHADVGLDASNALCGIGAIAIQPLVKSLEMEHNELAAVAAGAVLSRIGPPAIAPLVNLLGNAEDCISARAGKALQEMRGPGLFALLHCSSENNEFQRSQRAFDCLLRARGLDFVANALAHVDIDNRSRIVVPYWPGGNNNDDIRKSMLETARLIGKMSAIALRSLATMDDIRFLSTGNAFLGRDASVFDCSSIREGAINELIRRAKGKKKEICDLLWVETIEILERSIQNFARHLAPTEFKIYEGKDPLRIALRIVSRLGLRDKDDWKREAEILRKCGLMDIENRAQAIWTALK